MCRVQYLSLCRLFVCLQFLSGKSKINITSGIIILRCDNNKIFLRISRHINIAAAAAASLSLSYSYKKCWLNKIIKYLRRNKISFPTEHNIFGGLSKTTTHTPLNTLCMCSGTPNRLILIATPVSSPEDHVDRPAFICRERDWKEQFNLMASSVAFACDKLKQKLAGK